jgi:xanthine/uracil permease
LPIVGWDLHFSSDYARIDGQNVIDLRDINGKPIIRQITDVGRKPERDASGWVFYLWQNQAPLTPSCNLVMCEKVNDDEWTRPDTKRIGDGLMADGIAVTVSGLLGGVASDTSASNVSLSAASGATSRWIGVAAGTLFILLGFSPKLSAVLSIMPAPVVGAIVVFVVCFMVMSGLQIILSSKPDTRRTFVIGTALCFGLSLDILPDLYAHLAPWLRPVFESSLTLSTVVAVALNQLLRLEETLLVRRQAGARDTG